MEWASSLEILGHMYQTTRRLIPPCEILISHTTCRRQEEQVHYSTVWPTRMLPYENGIWKMGASKCRDQFHFWTWNLQMTRSLFRNKEKENMKLISVVYYNGILPGNRTSWELLWHFSAFVAAKTWSYELLPHPSTSCQNTAFANNIKMDLKDIRCKYLDWIYLAVDRMEVRALVNTKLYFYIPRKLRTLLTNWATLSIWRIILPHRGIFKIILWFIRSSWRLYFCIKQWLCH
jgi:hypothetical protein